MIPLSEEFKIQRGLKLVSLIEGDVRDMHSRYAAVRRNRSLYYGTAAAHMPVPWEGASNIHLPLLQDKTETVVPMVMMAFWGVDPVVNVQRSAEEYYEEQTDDVEQFMNFVLDKDVPDVYETFENWKRDMAIDGMSYIKPYWETSMRMVSEVHNLKKYYDIGEEDAAGGEAPEARFKTAMELLVDLFGQPNLPKNGLIEARSLQEGYDPEDLEAPVEGTLWEVYFIEDRRPYVGTVEFMQGTHIDEIRARVRRQIMDTNSAMVDNIEYEDLVVPYRTKTIQRADRVTQRYWLTVDEVEERVAFGEWELSEGDMEVIRGQGTRREDDSQQSIALQRQKDVVTGEGRGHGSEERMEAPEGYMPYNKNKIMVFDVYLRDDATGEGNREEVIYTIPYGLRKIVKAEFLDEVFPHGKRPFVVAKYVPVPDRFYGMGLGDQLSAINLEINAIINFINNNQELINNPFYFYEPASFNPDSEGIKGLAPGQGVPVLNAAGIVFPTFPQTPLSNMDMLTSLLMFADRLTISPLNSGSTQMKNAPRTARGTFALLGEGHVKTDMLITRLQRTSWMELMEQLFGLYQEFCPDEKWYWITRDDQQHRARITKKMLRGRYEFAFKGNTVNTNREVLRSLAQVRYATLITNPDYATDPAARQNLVRDFLKYWGDGSDRDRLLAAMPGQGAYAHPPMRQQDENKVIELGVAMPILPTDNDAEHLQVMDQYEKSTAFEAMPPHAVGIYATHKLQHMQALQAKAQQQTLPVGAGMANNVPQGQTAGNSESGMSDVNVMQGGVQ